ncbi:low specificity L-threonine aldolase [Curtobacterium sp. MCBD17_013]|uniref:threonine aldolase family protein n=1 Tax=unclassified Curtobacterium TaxID=257496 RepID=UPI000DA7AEC8|nr:MULTISPECIES: GntG family PLP-dependent aldolase [unclassified Curtobacterium]PZF63299.1 low specificity L-threonine aldolase [Curtobacterium sp. MCBD17_013]WIB64282.1 GntG family PLP-dependent aldolase [Curtobacterium sp. MCBD17_040]
MPIDLRSDTVTRPTAAMRAAMLDAEVGDDVYGEDPEVNALEAEVADLLGFEAGLYAPSGSMANQLGLRMLVAPGQELVCDVQAHVARAELGAAAVFSGITTRTWATPYGRLDHRAVEQIAEPDAGSYMVSTAAIAIENTHNFGGGTVQPQSEVRAVQEYARTNGLAVHLDGARLWNAHVASGTPLRELAAGFDTVSVCLSKGLGAPVGSVLVASQERIDAARIWRKRYGGGMRQVGMLAAAGRYAIRNHVDRLAEDHVNARLLAAAAGVDPATVESNIVFADVSDAARFAHEAEAQGVRVMQSGRTRIRMVTHLDATGDDITRAVDVLRGIQR